MSATLTAARRSMPTANAPAAARRRGDDPLPAMGPAPVLLDVDRLYENPDNARDDFDDDDPALGALVASLRTSQLINPIHVREEERPSGRHMIICGERRWRAARVACWTTIPAFICRLDRVAELQLVADENLQRKDLNAIELARQLAKLVAPEADGGAGMTREAVAKRYGYAEGSWVTNLVKLLRLPPAWQERIAAKDVAARSGKALVAYVDRPDIMAAVELDFSNNAIDWNTADKFDRQLAEVAERLDGLEKGAAGASVSRNTVAPSGANSSSSAAAAGMPEAQALLRRSAPVDHQLAGDEPAADAEPLDREGVREKLLTAVFDVLDRLRPEELGAVATYVDRRARGIEGPDARQAGRRPKRIAW